MVTVHPHRTVWDQVWFAPWTSPDIKNWCHKKSWDELLVLGHFQNGRHRNLEITFMSLWVSVIIQEPGFCLPQCVEHKVTSNPLVIVSEWYYSDGGGGLPPRGTAPGTWILTMESPGADHHVPLTRTAITCHTQQLTNQRHTVKTKYLYNICTMLDQRWRCWESVVQMLYYCVVFAGPAAVTSHLKLISYCWLSF